MVAVPVRAQEAIIQAGRRMDRRGWVPATAGNISLRMTAGADYLAITRSGGHKGFLDGFSVIAVDLDGRALTPGDRPSAETLLHCAIYREVPEAAAVLHGHSVAGTVLSMAEPGPGIAFEGYEVFKAFAGQTTHEAAWCCRYSTTTRTSRAWRQSCGRISRTQSWVLYPRPRRLCLGA